MVNNPMDFTRNHYKTTVLDELTSLIKKDQKRKICKDCGVIGHNSKIQRVCSIKVKEDAEKKEKIKNYIMDIDCLEKYDEEVMFLLLAESLDISVNYCRTLYAEIPPEILLDRKLNIESFVKHIDKVACLNCNEVILEFSKNRIWRDKVLCDYCWDSHKGEREIMWGDIHNHKKVECYICNKEKRCKGDRFHYDHLNMFDKNDSICSMVDRGDDMEDIFSEIDKCQILCVPCHHVVTSIEQKTGFTRIKSGLTRKYNNEEISSELYNTEKERYQIIYRDKMKSIYEELKKVYINK